MTLKEQIEEIVNKPRSIETVKAAFKVHNENFQPKATNMSCGACVNRVFKRLNNYVQNGI